MPMSSAILLYDHPLSGNCHKIRMFLRILGIDFKTELMDVLKKENQSSWFGRLNPLRQIPVLLDGDVTVQDSQAILAYLAMKYGREWISDVPCEMAAIMEWLSYAAKEVSNGPQLARLHFLADEDIDISRAQAEGRRVLAHLEESLNGKDWLCLGRPTIADLACFPYAALSREGHLPLDDHSNVIAWIGRIAELPGYVAMPGLPGGLLHSGGNQ